MKSTLSLLRSDDICSKPAHQMHYFMITLYEEIPEGSVFKRRPQTINELFTHHEIKAIAVSIIMFYKFIVGEVKYSNDMIFKRKLWK